VTAPRDSFADRRTLLLAACSIAAASGRRPRAMWIERDVHEVARDWMRAPDLLRERNEALAQSLADARDLAFLKRGHAAHEADNATLRARIATLEAALRSVSLTSQNSMSSKEDCGRIARAALVPTAAPKGHYVVQVVNDGPRYAADAPAALNLAGTYCFRPNDRIAADLESLRAGRAVSWSYGFTSVTVTPVDTTEEPTR